MVDASEIKEHAKVIGADGVHLGTVDKLSADADNAILLEESE